MDAIRYKHSKNAGDLVASLPGLRKIYLETGRKGIIYQRLGLEAFYYEGASHPLKNDSGINICMNDYQWDMLKPLLEAQEYIDHCEVFKGQPFDIDFDRVMHDKQIPLPAGGIHHWIFFIAPELACDLGENWLTVEIDEKYNWLKDKLIVNKTQRYGNPHITYYFLKKHAERLIFTGTKEENDIFNKNWELEVPYLEVSDFLDLAKAIKSAKGFLGSQSMCWHIADSMHVPRILEYCPQFPNCHPTGANGYAFIHQQALELYVHKILK